MLPIVASVHKVLAHLDHELLCCHVIIVATSATAHSWQIWVREVTSAPFGAHRSKRTCTTAAVIHCRMSCCEGNGNVHKSGYLLPVSMAPPRFPFLVVILGWHLTILHRNQTHCVKSGNRKQPCYRVKRNLGALPYIAAA